MAIGTETSGSDSPVHRASEQIRLRGVRTHNLQGIDLDLPRNQLIAVTGLSGSGKSSLAFDTLYAEGQRRYVETFSPHARQFLSTLDPPEAELIEGLPPAIAVSQHQRRWSGRSTVGSVTEIDDYLAILFARLGTVVCQSCGREVKPADLDQVVARIQELPHRSRYQIAFPVEILPETDRESLARALREDGFLRVRVGGELSTIDDGSIPTPKVTTDRSTTIDVIVDRLVRGSEESARRNDSIELGFSRGFGRLKLITEAREHLFARDWSCLDCGIEYHPPEPRLFRPQSPAGACPKCEGTGTTVALSMDRIVPDHSKSLAEGAIAPWNDSKHRSLLTALLRTANRLKIPIDRPFHELTAEQRALIQDGSPPDRFLGIGPFFERLERQATKPETEAFLSKWRSEQPCSSCNGTRLRAEALAVEIEGYNIGAIREQTISDSLSTLSQIAARTDKTNAALARRSIEPVLTRLRYLDRIGLSYLQLNRTIQTLSQGESRRVALTRALGSGLVETLYVFDEPSTGLHPQDLGRLLEALRELRSKGNTVVVVEHHETITSSCDQILEIGPGAGAEGGKLLYQGPPEGIIVVEASPTGQSLSHRRYSTAQQMTRRVPSEAKLVLKGASAHNLKNIDVELPLGLICCITGVSGSGKSTLVRETLYPGLLAQLNQDDGPRGSFQALSGAEFIDAVVLIDTTPIGRSSRSNPATYLKVFDEIRRAFAETHEAKSRNYGPGRFSFNVPGGRCESCEGSGHRVIDMQFLSDVVVRCPECSGNRFRKDTLEVTYRGKNIAEVLDLTAREAFGFFKNRPKVQMKLRPLIDVGLDYLRLGQPVSTLSGGEAQRLKLAGYLPSSASATVRSTTRRTLFLFDEPTTGLHTQDIMKFLETLSTLADLGHSLIIVTHHPEVMLFADWMIDLGPGAGADGGRVVAQGTPEVIAQASTATGQALASRMAL